MTRVLLPHGVTLFHADCRDALRAAMATEQDACAALAVFKSRYA